MLYSTKDLTPAPRRLPPLHESAAGICIPAVPSHQEIMDYYSGSKLDYQLYNMSADNLSMHYGFWDQTTRTHRQALLNENRVVAELAAICGADRVADFGCGYGATAVWLASHVGCRVHGITLSEEQVEDANRLAGKHHVAHLTAFSQADYHQSGLPAGSFDVVIAIESLAHSSQKECVLREAFRVLKPGGRIAVADGFFGKPWTQLSDREQEIARNCFAGVHVPPLPERFEFEAWLSSAGFIGVEWDDRTQAILPTARRVNHLGRALMPVSRLCGVLGLRALQPSHMRAFIDQYYAFRDGLGVYGVYVARKAGIRIRSGTGGSRC